MKKPIYNKIDKDELSKVIKDVFIDKDIIGKDGVLINDGELKAYVSHETYDEMIKDVHDEMIKMSGIPKKYFGKKED